MCDEYSFSLPCHLLCRIWWAQCHQSNGDFPAASDPPTPGWISLADLQPHYPPELLQQRVPSRADLPLSATNRHSGLNLGCSVRCRLSVQFVIKRGPGLGNNRGLVIRIHHFHLTRWEFEFQKSQWWPAPIKPLVNQEANWGAKPKQKQRFKSFQGPNGRIIRARNCGILRFASPKLFSMLSLPTLDSMCQSLQVHPQTKELVMTPYGWPR